MPSEFVKEQLEKLLIGKVLLILDETDFEEIVLAAVPSLIGEADDLEKEGNFVKAQQLQRIARELDTSPTKQKPPIINISQAVH